MSSIITIVAKGPSAAHAQQWIHMCPDSDVATINEAGLLLHKDQRIRFGFVCHAHFVERMRPLWRRIDCFVSPAQLVGPQELPADFPRHKHIRYVGNRCCGSRSDLYEKLQAGFVTHHHTVTAAMSWLAKVGYKHLRIIGLGGQGYAPGLQGQPDWSSPGDQAVWIEVVQRLALLLQELYDVKTEQYQ